MKTLYFDLISGASGDMLLAALIDLGLPLDFLNRELARLGIPGLSVARSRVRRNGIMCCQIKITWKTQKDFRHLDQIVTLIKKAKFDASIFDRCVRVLNRLAQAEARVHGIPIDHVHFHEIGAVDTIADVVGVCLGLSYFSVDDIRFSVLTEGEGTIECEHGILPVPAPATELLMRGFQVRRVPVQTELLTPTGCALLTTLGTQEPFPDGGKAVKTGYGCGTKIIKDHPNFLRAYLIESPEAGGLDPHRDTVSLLETDMDHLSGEIMGNVAELLLGKGALDVSWTPIFMKKGRPGYRLSVMVQPDQCRQFVDLIMLHTRTLGVRVQEVKRIVAQRKNKDRRWNGTLLREKQCSYKGHSFTKPEYEDVARLAREKGASVLELLDQLQCGNTGKK